jgi:hypothetical protein
VKVGATATLAGISYDFGLSTVTRTRIMSLESHNRYFQKGYGRPPGLKSIPNPQADEAVVLEDFFTVDFLMPLHPIVLDISRKFRVQLHQLTLNAIIQIGKFICAVTSCGGCPTADVFAHHYQLHYRHKKVHLQGCKTTLATQFGCISFHPSQFGNQAKLAPTCYEEQVDELLGWQLVLLQGVGRADG